MFFLQWAAVRPVAKGVEQGTHFHAFGRFLGQQVEQGVGDGVVAEVEIFQMDVMSGTANGFEQVGELVMPVHQQFYFVVVGQWGTHLFQPVHDDAVAGALRMHMSCKQKQEHSEADGDMY